MKIYQNKESLQRIYDEYGSYEKVANALACNPKTIMIWAKKLGIVVKEQYKGAAKKHFYNNSHICLKRKFERFKMYLSKVLPSSNREVINVVNSVNACSSDPN